MGIFDAMPHPYPGHLITFCGLDGCGKTTLLTWLKGYLEERGMEVFLTKQPTPYVRESAIFRTYMDQPDHSAYDYRSLSLLAASDRIQHCSRVIVPALEKGSVVISDRYFYSCLANLRARGYTQDRWIYEVAGFIPKPDLAIFIDVDVEEAVRRVRAREEEKDRYIDMELQYRLREEYLDIAGAAGGMVLSSAQPLQEEKAALCRLVDEVLKDDAHRHDA